MKQSSRLLSALGVGTTQSNLAVFAAEQIRDLKSISRYAGTFQIVLNIGDIIAIVFVSYLKNDSKHFHIAYVIITGILLISILLFFMACRYSIRIQPYDTILTKCIPVFIDAYRSKKKYRQQSLHNFNNIENSIKASERPSSFVDYAKIVHYGKFQDRIVNDTKALVRTIIVFSLVIPYWIVYNQVREKIIES